MSSAPSDETGLERTARTSAAGRSVLKVFLFTDLVNSTAWKKTLGDRDYAMDVLAPHDRLCRSLIAEYHGASLNNDMGDGYLATFPTPGDAVGFALRFHDALAREPWGASVGRSGRVPSTRIGIHLGEHIELDQLGTPKLSGQAVDLAARVMGLSQPGQTLLTRHAFDSARQYVLGNPVDPATPLAFVYHGQYRFKGNEDDPLEIFGVAPAGSPTVAPPPDSEKAKRVKVDEDDDTGSWRPAVALEIPRRDGWFLERKLGEGGFGEVWLARHRRTKEQRVFKFCFDADRLRSFKRELTFFKLIQRELGARPDMVKLHEVQVEKPPYFLECEFVPAGDLGHWLEHSGGFDRWPLSQRLVFLAETSRAVAAAHSLGIIHKDLKPSNILVRLDAAGTAHPLLADFGIGVLADRSKLQQGNITETGFTDSIMFGNDSSRTGTRLYAPPESQLGKSATTGTDVYALGVMLFQFSAAQIQEPLGVGWEEKIDAGDPDRTELLRGDIRAATYALPDKRLPAAIALAERLETLDARVAERKAVAEREAEDRRREERGRKAKLRRRVLAALVLVLVAAGVVANEVRTQREADRLAAERQRADDRIAAEEKRLADLRQARADSLVQALTGPDTASVPRVLSDLAEVRDLAGPRLRELVAHPITTKPGLHARLALLADEPHRTAELAAYVLECRPDELLPIRGLLAPHAAAVAPGLWAVLLDAQSDRERRVRAAGVLAGWAAQDSRWPAVAPTVVEGVVRSTPGEFVVWAVAFEPVRLALLPELLRRYPAARGRIQSGKLSESELVAEASGFDLTAALQVRYMADRLVELREVASTVDSRHFQLFTPAIMANRVQLLPLLRAELGRKPLPDWATPPRDGIGLAGGYAMAAAAGAPGLIDALNPDPVLDAAARRRINAAVAMLVLGEAGPVWPEFRYPADGDPSARSYLVERLAAVKADPLVLIRRFAAEDDVSARRALVVALGDYPPDAVPPAERTPFVSQLLKLYREHPDPGLHGAIVWLLRQRWKSAEVVEAVEAIDTELAAGARRAGMGAGPGAGMGWYVNGTGQTYAVVRRPVAFTFGSPVTEPGRFPDETPHRKHIGRSFAVGTREVTVAEFLRLLPGHMWEREYSPEANTPVVSVTWFEAAEYCNKLSEQEGLAKDHWCYEPNGQGKYAKGMRIKPGHLRLSGYRLPTEAEWEYACRAGAGTARPYGRGVDLLPRYAWGPKNADDRTWPVGQLRPNDLGLFDTLGNAWEWTEDPYVEDATKRPDDVEYEQPEVTDLQLRVLRGGSFRAVTPAAIRSASRNAVRPGTRNFTFGFRPARTIPD